MEQEYYSENTIITIGTGETLSGAVWDAGESVTVAAGATLDGAEMTFRGDSLTLEAGSTVKGTLTVGSSVTVNGTINAADADIVLNISHRYEEDPLLWSDIAAAAAKSYSLTVNANQNKGTYLLAGNAADFAGVITVRNSAGTELGTLSLAANVLDFDVTRYTLALNEAGILTVTVSSNIADDSSFVFLYKDNHLVSHRKEGFALELSAAGEFDHLVIIENGVAGNIKILSGGVVTVYQGAFAAGIEQAADGKLRFDYSAGDKTLISGVNQYGTFLVQNNKLYNVHGENVNLTGALTVVDYHSGGVFTASDGVEISGIFTGGSNTTFKKGVTISNAVISGNNFSFEAGITVKNSEIASGSNRYFRGGTYENVTISGSNNCFYGGTYGNVTLNNGGVYYANITLNGTLTIKDDFNRYGFGTGYIDAAGNTIILDYTSRTINDSSIIDGNYVSEDALFRIDLLADQGIGTYQLIGTGRNKYSFTIFAGNRVIGTITHDNTSFEYGNYSYTITSGKELIIDVSENADASFNVLYWRADGTVGHAAELFTAATAKDKYQQIIVRRNGIAGDITLDTGGLLDVQKGGTAVGVNQKNNGALRFNYSKGDTTVISGVNQYGTFFVANDLLLNVAAETVNLSGEISVQDFRVSGNLTASGGVAFTGVIDTGSKEAVFGDKDGKLAAVTISDAAVSGYNKTFYNVTVSNSTIGGTFTYFRNGTYSNVTVNGSYSYFYGGTFSDSVWQQGNLAGAVALTGTLTVTGNINTYGGVINANGNTIILDLTKRTVSSSAMLAANRVSEDVVFQLDLLDDQAVGTYTILSGAGSFIDTFNISVAGDIIGTLNNGNTSFEYGNFSYSMGWDNISQNITLTIDISENADEKYNVLCYTADDVLSYAKEMTGMVIDGTACAKVTVRNGGWLADTKLNNGILTVRKGAVITGLEQSASGKLRFDYSAGDNTLISGVNQYGTFFVQNDKLINVSGENVTVSGEVTLQEYHSGGSFAGNGITVTGNFYGSGSFENAAFSAANVTGTARISGNSSAADTVFAGAEISGGYFENVTVSGNATLAGGTFNEVTLAGGASIRGRAALEGKLVIANTVECVSSYSVNGAIDANGYEVALDLTARSPISDALINLDRVYNADLTITVFADQTLGTYAIGTKAGNFGKGDGEGFWDIDTNTWLYKNAVEGDLDGVITIRSSEGIELARCTVNGDTEYFGRYNYRVYTDEKDVLQLRIGWNNKEDITFAADVYDNNSLQTATRLDGTGKISLGGLTIHDKNDVDFFKFTLDRSGTSGSCISISFKQWAGDLDMELLDASGKRIAYASSVTDDETISLQGMAAGDYYLKVYGYDGETNGYTINADLPVKPQFKDDYEKGDSSEKCYHLGELAGEKTLAAAITAAGDQDFYSFVLNRTGTAADGVTLTFDEAYGDLDIYLYDASGTRVLGKSVSVSSGSESISFKGLAAGCYMVKVTAKNGQDVADYKLDFSIRAAKEIAPDKYENNNTLKKAKNLYALNGRDKNKNLSVHSADDVDYFKFKLKETGSADDWIAIDYEAVFGDLDIEILNDRGKVVAWSRTAENNDTASLEGLAAGNYYIRVTGYNGAVNNYDMSWNITNSGLIPSDSYEGGDPIRINQDQTISGLTIAMPQKEDETRADVFAIQLEYDAWKSSRIILTDFRADWKEGMKWTISSDPDGKNVLASGKGSEISLAGYRKGTYYLTVDAPEDNQFSKYSLIASDLPDSPVAVEKNNWSIFVYLAGDNNLEGSYLQELLWMQQAIIPEGVEVYVLMDRSGEYSVDERNWSDTRVGKIVHSPGSAVAVQWLYFDGEDSDIFVNTSNLEHKKEWDTGDVATLGAFLDWGMKVGKADNYALIMKDHGTNLGFNSSDETSGSIMRVQDVAELLSDAKYDALKVVAFDQCLMGNDVVISSLEGNIDYVVASEAIGWTPNLLVMYKVLFNSLEADMSAQELAQKIVKACNCSGRVDLTSASFHVADKTLSGALNEFARAASGFTRADWVEICKSFALAYNYGDSICASSDLGFLLNAIQHSESISAALLNAAEKLYTVVLEQVIDSTMIVPASYGTGFAVFNPVLSNDLMSFYSYGPGANLDYYGTEIGSGEWGQFLYTVGQLAEDCTEYFVDGSTQLTFTDFSYSFADGEVQVNCNLGTFYGDGVDFNGLYLDDELYFTITLDGQGAAGDQIRAVADNPDAEVSLTLVQQRPVLGGVELITRRISENGILSLAGIDHSNAGVLNEYFLIVSTTAETTLDLSFEADWTSGSDYFDYSRSGNKLGVQGNGSLDKATVLGAGNYGGLVTYQGDADYYQLNTVYSNEIDVVISGSGLSVCEYDRQGKVVRHAAENNGSYTITIANGNYLYVQGNADIASGKVNSYSLKISDVAHTYLAPVGGIGSLPQVKISAVSDTPAQEVTLTAESGEGMKTYCSADLQKWTLFEGTYTASANGIYYFKAVDPESGLESKYTSVNVTSIDREPPAKPSVSADILAPTTGKVTVTAQFPVDSELKQYSLDGSTWLTYTAAIVMANNGVLYFRAVDKAGNISEVAEFEVNNIDKIAPILEISGNATAPTNKDVILTATASDGTVEYFANGKWNTGSSLTVTANGIYKFRVTDAAGNVTEKSVKVDMIDKVAPTLEISGNATAPTNKDVILTATASDGTVEYWNGAEWITGNTITATTNGTYQFRVTDSAGNITEKSVTVDMIDKVAPALEISGNVDSPTNQDVVLTATASDGTVEYFANGKWNTGSSLTVTANGIYKFRVTDAAGNVTEKSVTVDMIDKVAPTLEISGNVETPTNQDVILTATASDGTVEYYDGKSWVAGNKLTVSENGIYKFRVTDAAGNVTEKSVVVDQIDKIAPTLEISGNATAPTNKDVILTATASDGTVEYFANSKWNIGSSLTVTTNGTYKFRVTDAAGNVTEKSVTVDMIDKVAPTAPTAVASTSGLTGEDVIVTAEFSSDSIIKEYRLDDGEWQKYIGAFTVTENTAVYFRAFDAAGNCSTSEMVVDNIDKIAPEVPGNFSAAVSNYDVKLDWADAADSGVAGVKGYYIRYGTDGNLTGEGSFISSSELVLNALAVGKYSYQVQTVDNAGNISQWSSLQTFEVVPGVVTELQGSADGLKWQSIAGVGGYRVEVISDGGTLSLKTDSAGIDFFSLPAGTYQWQVKADGGSFTSGSDIVSANAAVPQKYISDADGNTDIFFANGSEVWGSGYAAEHQGVINGWTGTEEQVILAGKNKLSDIFEGSSDANILVLTDAANGDALFVDDIYTSFGSDAARISQIDEIRAGFGDDIVDMTSQQFAYAGGGVKIYGGLGNDTIWANNGNNTLFGDAGNDRIVGGGNNDVIAGGIGNDSMHGGGGSDIFCFGKNWGNDTVEQLDGGEITLWFESGSENNWDADTLTYTDGTNSVTVRGVAEVSLKFGGDAPLDGVFLDAASEKIFEDKNSGMLV